MFAKMAGALGVAFGGAMVAAVALSCAVPSVAVAAETMPGGSVVVTRSRGYHRDALRCPCGTVAVCVGPKGGSYCITDKGKKRYL